MGLAGVALSVAGVGMSAYASYAAGKANREINNYNAAVMDMQAADALTRGEEAAGQIGTQTRQLVGAQRVALAAQGLAVDQGSAEDVQAAAQEMARRDERTVTLNAMREAWGYRAQARSYRMAGKNAYRGGTLNAAGQALAGAGQAANQYDTLKRNGG